MNQVTLTDIIVWLVAQVQKRCLSELIDLDPHICKRKGPRTNLNDRTPENLQLSKTTKQQKATSKLHHTFRKQV